MKRILSTVVTALAAIAAGLLVAWGLVQLTKGPFDPGKLVATPPPNPANAVALADVRPKQSQVLPVATTIRPGGVPAAQVPTVSLTESAGPVDRNAARRAIAAAVPLGTVRFKVEPSASVTPAVLSAASVEAPATLPLATVNLSRSVAADSPVMGLAQLEALPAVAIAVVELTDTQLGLAPVPVASVEPKVGAAPVRLEPIALAADEEPVRIAGAVTHATFPDSPVTAGQTGLDLPLSKPIRPASVATLTPAALHLEPHPVVITVDKPVDERPQSAAVSIQPSEQGIAVGISVAAVSVAEVSDIPDINLRPVAANPAISQATVSRFPATAMGTVRTQSPVADAVAQIHLEPVQAPSTPGASAVLPILDSRMPSVHQPAKVTGGHSALAVPVPVVITADKPENEWPQSAAITIQPSEQGIAVGIGVAAVSVAEASDIPDISLRSVPANPAINYATISPLSEVNEATYLRPAGLTPPPLGPLTEAIPGLSTTPDPARFETARIDQQLRSTPLLPEETTLKLLTNSVASRLVAASASVANPAAGLTLAALVAHTFPVYFGLPFMAYQKQPVEPLADADLVPGYPVVVARSYSGTTPELQAWLEQWEAGIRQGKLQAESRVSRQSQTAGEELKTLLSHTSLTCTQLVAIGRGIEAVEGFLAAAPFYREAVARAEKELAGHGRHEPADAPVLHALICMGWFAHPSIHEHAMLERIYRLLMEHVPADSPIAFQAEFLQAEMLYELGRNGDKARSLEAATRFRAMLTRPMIAKWPAGDVAFFHWAIAAAYVQGKGFADALPHLETVIRQNQEPYVNWAWSFYISALANDGRIAAAREAYTQWLERRKPSQRTAQYLAQLISEAELRNTAAANKHDQRRAK